METLKPGRHNRGWPRITVLTYIVISDTTWRYCIEPMGTRDSIWERSGYVELIVWRKQNERLESDSLDGATR